MKISILTPDFSHNCFGRAWLLAKLLQENYDIEVIGPAFGDGIWKPLKFLCDFPVKIVNGYPNGQFEFKKMLRIIYGDVIYASKPLMASFGVGLVKKYLTRKPLVLDIDDWELGFGKEFYDSLPLHKKINDFRLSFSNFRYYYYSVILDKLIPYANTITVSGNVLRRKYGGTAIWHCRDSNLFDPAKYDSLDLKKKYLNSPEKAYIVGFIGSPRPHKGLEDLIEALEILNKKEIFLMIVGIVQNEYGQKLMRRINSSIIKENVLPFTEQAFEQIPEFLAISDLVVIPQRKTSSSYGQVPAKIFDAMAMAKPVIATRVSDIPKILNGHGWLVKHEAPRQLAEMIEYLVNHQEEAKEKGERAREKYKSEYSWDTIAKELTSIIEKYEAR
jgi:glycosyltransferase involved in cell wall biosynthesis